ncbi:MAG TPA: hypothetical protein VFB50_20300, partial [Chloroflexota bacterium]|nr:hypothetical protein [Chloroflexota bacterium]
MDEVQRAAAVHAALVAQHQRCPRSAQRDRARIRPGVRGLDCAHRSVHWVDVARGRLHLRHDAHAVADA